MCMGSDFTKRSRAHTHNSLMIVCDEIRIRLGHNLKYIFTRFQLWSLKSRVKWIPPVTAGTYTWISPVLSTYIYEHDWVVQSCVLHRRCIQINTQNHWENYVLISISGSILYALSQVSGIKRFRMRLPRAWNIFYRSTTINVLLIRCPIRQ